MPSSKTPDKNHLVNDPEKGLQDDFQDDPSRGSQNNDAPAYVGPLQGQGSTSSLERFFTTMYPFQTLLMLQLNRLDFKHLLLAGVKTPISLLLQKKFLVPSKCDELLVIEGMDPVPCSNTSQSVTEIKACHGLHHDGWGLRGRQEKWIEPVRLLKHVSGSDSLVERTIENEGGHFDSFNVCIRCHDRDRLRRAPYEDFTIQNFWTLVCISHASEYLKQRPYNTCRCKLFLEKYWRCHVCSLDTLDELRLRSQTFGQDPFPNFRYDDEAKVYIDRGTENPRKTGVCPILGCDGHPWLSGPTDKQVLLCRACTAIFPRPS